MCRNKNREHAADHAAITTAHSAIPTNPPNGLVQQVGKVHRMDKVRQVEIGDPTQKVQQVDKMQDGTHEPPVIYPISQTEPVHAAETLPALSNAPNGTQTIRSERASQEPLPVAEGTTSVVATDWFEVIAEQRRQHAADFVEHLKDMTRRD